PEARLADPGIRLAEEGHVAIVRAQHLPGLRVHRAARRLAHAVGLVLAGLGPTGASRRVGLTDLVAALVVLVRAIARRDVAAKVDRARDDAVPLAISAFALALA